jgi:murein DD-endopeptidase MepM/ murein hydrolase activator NlpD
VTFLSRVAGIVLLASAAACTAAADGIGSGRHADIRLPRETATIEAKVPARATLASLLVANHLSADLAAGVVSAARTVFDPRGLKTDRTYRLTTGLDGAFREFQYEIDADRCLSVALHNGAGAAQPMFDVTVLTTPRTIERRAIVTDISREHSSLVGSLDARGENIELALRLAAILGGEVDFNSDLQPGDRISALFDRVVRSGVAGEYGEVDAAILQNAGRRIVAIRFDGVDGKPNWYDEDGRSLKRQFLKSPLPFEPRITSGFSFNRLHPVYGETRAHMGVDYYAPVGTSVVAVSAGVVESAAWAGDAGRMVVLRHAGGYETLYLHLSSFAVRPGQHVDQGALIGRTGDSGAVTGPHLDYRIKKNGGYVNPLLELQRMPKGDPIDPDALPAFRDARDRALQELTTRIAAHQDQAPAGKPQPPVSKGE